MKKRLKKVPIVFILIGSAAFLIVSTIFYIGYVTVHIDNRINQLHSTKSSVFYSSIPPLKVSEKFSITELQSYLQDQGYVETKRIDEIKEGEYFWEQKPTALILYRNSFLGAGHGFEAKKVKVEFTPMGTLYETSKITLLSDNTPLESVESIPKQIGSYFAGRMRTQNFVPLSDIPIFMRLSVMAIEDVSFLKHHGVSIRGAIRALWNDLKHLKWVQGGSTLTQQLMKNLFFSREKAISRKFKEALYALITELKFDKETILEAYLNEVYMGQWGSHEIHGVAEGARYYFNRHVTQLTLSQSATLAAIVQAPNAMDPKRHLERLTKRRNLVLKKMVDADFISEEESQEAEKEPIIFASEKNIEDVGYFLDYLLSTLPVPIRNRLDNEALTLYTTLNLHLQNLAVNAVNKHLEKLEQYYLPIQQAKNQGVQLQSVLISVSTKDCSILALEGGRNFRLAPFNRAVLGKRQPGSLFKPFVFLTAFENTSKDIEWTPDTLVEDTPFEWKYEGGQTWIPKNYDEKFKLQVTIREALESSINVPTARVAEKVGIQNIVKNIQKAGVRSPLPMVPSISLGSAEVTPLELTEAYTTIANLGQHCTLRGYNEIFDENKNLVSENKLQFQNVLSPKATFQTIDVLKGVFTNGTARSVKNTTIPYTLFAGKTGTTNDYKDAWFVGFNPDFLTLVWVGYDENRNVGLTGSVAALPIWSDYISKLGPAYIGQNNFVPPEN